MTKIMITFKEGGNNGGPFNSHQRILESNLNEKYNFIPLYIPKGRLGLLNLKLTYKIIKQVKDVKPDIVHFTGLELTGFHVALALKLLNFNASILAVHGSTNESNSHSLFKKVIMNLLEYMTIKWSGHMYTVSEYVDKWDIISKEKNKNFGTIYNLVDIKNSEKSSVKKNIRRELMISTETVIAVSTGRIEIEKGFKDLVKIIKNDNNKNLVFLIVGEGSYLNEMKSELVHEFNKNKVYFLGYRNDIKDILKASNLFILPTWHETFCMSIAEAISVGLPVLSNNVGGIPEIIENNINGYLFEVGDNFSYNREINELVDNLKLRIKMSENAKEIFLRKFSNENSLNQLDQLYTKVLNTCKKG